jgi:hypothetical protein
MKEEKQDHTAYIFTFIRTLLARYDHKKLNELESVVQGVSRVA